MLIDKFYKNINPEGSALRWLKLSAILIYHNKILMESSNEKSLFYVKILKKIVL